MGTSQYDIFKRVSDLKTRFEKGQSLNCTDIAAAYNVSTKTANRYLDLLRNHFQLKLIYNPSSKNFSLTR